MMLVIVIPFAALLLHTLIAKCYSLTRRRLKSMKRHYNQQISIDMQSLTVELVHSYSHASDIELTMYIMLYVVP